MNESDIDSFWTDLYAALHRLEIPMALRTRRAADVGWGRGMRILMLDDGRITHPSGKFVRIDSITPTVFASDIRTAFKLTRRERTILRLLQDGAETYRHRSEKTVRVGNQIARESTIERLCFLGIVQELSIGSDCEYVAVTPESVHR